jgi:hypothetical protein
MSQHLGGVRIEAIGRVRTFFAKPGVAAIILSAPLRVGESVYIKGTTTDFRQPVTSLQIDRRDVLAAGPGQRVGLRVCQRCRPHDLVFKIVSESPTG